MLRYLSPRRARSGAYNKDGYDRDGYDVWGYDRDGYDKYGYDEDGYDQTGHMRIDVGGHSLESVVNLLTHNAPTWHIWYAIRAGADIDEVDEYGQSTLILALDRQRYNIAQSLLAVGVDANVADVNGRTALMYAASNGHAKLVQALIEAGANIDAANVDGRTALMYAIMHRHVPTIKILLSAGANVAAVDTQGRCVLTYAIFTCDEDVVSTVLDMGGQTTLHIKDKHGQTPLMVALSRCSPEVAELVMAHNPSLRAVDNKGRDAVFYLSRGQVRR